MEQQIIPVEQELRVRSEIIDDIKDTLNNAQAANTRASYASQWKQWITWCQEQDCPHTLPVHPGILILYLRDRARSGCKLATLKVVLATISAKHREGDHVDPTKNPRVKEYMKGFANEQAALGVKQKQAKGLTGECLAAIKATACHPRRMTSNRTEKQSRAEHRGAVDVALVMLMRDGLLRISEVANLTWDDLTIQSDGSSRLTIRRSKTDSEGEGAVQFISPATSKALMRICLQGEKKSERIFPFTVQHIRRRIKAACQAAGLGDGFSGHSSRVGMAQDLVAAGTDLTSLMNAGRWTTSRMPARYTREQEAGRGAVARYYGMGR